MNLSAKHTRSIIILFILGALAMGCATVELPLSRDGAYPSDWPEIITAGHQCEDIHGTYRNEGIGADEKGNQAPVFLSSLLELRDTAWDDRRAKTKSVTLSILTRRVENDGDSLVELEVTLNGDPGDPVFEKYAADFTRREMLEKLFCLEKTLDAGNRRQWGDAYIGWLGGGEIHVWLTKSTDGSLIARIRKRKAGLILIFPYNADSLSWAIFRPVGEP